MSGASANIAIYKEGPRDHLEVDPEPIDSADTAGLTQVLAEVRLHHAAACSFDSPKLSDAEAVIAGLKPRVASHTDVSGPKQRSPMSLYLHRHDARGIAIATAQDGLRIEVAKLDDHILSRQRSSEFIHAERLNAAHRVAA